jgi:hypothetical protein
MQDQDAPPVEEGETGGAVGVVSVGQIREAVPVAISNTAESTRPQWITAIVPP